MQTMKATPHIEFADKFKATTENPEFRAYWAEINDWLERRGESEARYDEVLHMHRVGEDAEGAAEYISLNMR